MVTRNRAANLIRQFHYTTRVKSVSNADYKNGSDDATSEPFFISIRLFTLFLPHLLTLLLIGEFPLQNHPKRKSPDAFCQHRDFLHSVFLFPLDTPIYRCVGKLTTGDKKTAPNVFHSEPFFSLRSFFNFVTFHP